MATLQTTASYCRSVQPRTPQNLFGDEDLQAHFGVAQKRGRFESRSHTPIFTKAATHETTNKDDDDDDYVWFTN